MEQTPKFQIKGWWVVCPTLAILALVLVLTFSSTGVAAAPLTLSAPTSTLLFQAQEPVCQSCHPEEYDVWKTTTHANATLDPAFQEQLAKSHNQEACLSCHTTGFDSGSGKFMSEGVTCEACHGQYKEGHPKAETMQLPMQSETCRMCHSAAFGQWETSEHQTAGVDCFDCHQAHSQGLRLGTVEQQCAACHTDENTRLAHSKHNISGIDCGSCHMAKQTHETAAAIGTTMAMSNHTFAVASDVCARCHTDSIHSAVANEVKLAAPTENKAAVIENQARRVAELEEQYNAAEKRNTDLRNIAVVAMGLAFGVGGAAGLVVGIGGTALLSRRKSK
jgi:hypothetical protein